MTPLALWAAVALVALAATAAWALVARQTGVYVTSGLSFTAWSWVALTGGDVAMLVAGSPHYVRDGPASVQFVATALAVISLVVFALRLMGAYPSPQDNAAETEQSAAATD